MMPIDRQQSYLTSHDGTEFQVLKYDDDLEAYFWDEAATAALYHAHEKAIPPPRPPPLKDRMARLLRGLTG